MTTSLFSAVGLGPEQELRLERHRLPARKNSPPQAALSIRLWTSLSGMTEKVPTGKGILISASCLQSFREAVVQAEQSFASTSDIHE